MPVSGILWQQRGSFKWQESLACKLLNWVKHDWVSRTIQQWLTRLLSCFKCSQGTISFRSAELAVQLCILSFLVTNMNCLVLLYEKKRHHPLTLAAFDEFGPSKSAHTFGFIFSHLLSWPVWNLSSKENFLYNSSSVTLSSSRSMVSRMANVSCVSRCEV